MNPFEKIISFLNDNAINFELVEHISVYTSEQAAGIRGFSLHQGAKSLLLKTPEEFILAIIPGDTRLDSKKLKEILNCKKLRFANPEEVKEIMHCEIGACYPFGNLIKTRMYIDKTLAENEIIALSPGVNDKSIKMKWEDYRKILNPELVDIVE